MEAFQGAPKTSRSCGTRLNMYNDCFGLKKNWEEDISAALVMFISSSFCHQTDHESKLAKALALSAIWTHIYTAVCVYVCVKYILTLIYYFVYFRYTCIHMHTVKVAAAMLAHHVISVCYDATRRQQ
uniref:Uncharacterized protein n=1 Tax=Lotharella globosa TaxID=91324 RepID=A0A7S3Y794_9EUKA|mmetsp:Transcript_14294/g.27013  ORF Transcript_14294/g.27013 Transcript_14294/m.27013 type:complete len:127 (+) Transcript_14294:732-1112(+)